MTSNKGLLMGVYLEQFSQSNLNGTFRIPFFSLIEREPVMIMWYISNDINNNNITFSLDKSQKMTFSGNLKYSDRSTDLHFTFNGILSPYSEKKISNHI